mmetsp:Transcript_6274/g.19059  ORF Transcript_6274/g.19059 Transcript_6274/m.19059 type:complete len:203 (-) Transcript_6274:156-764(-)
MSGHRFGVSLLLFEIEFLQEGLLLRSQFDQASVPAFHLSVLLVQLCLNLFEITSQRSTFGTRLANIFLGILEMFSQLGSLLLGGEQCALCILVLDTSGVGTLGDLLLLTEHLLMALIQCIEFGAQLLEALLGAVQLGGGGLDAHLLSIAVRVGSVQIGTHALQLRLGHAQPHATCCHHLLGQLVYDTLHGGGFLLLRSQSLE